MRRVHQKIYMLGLILLSGALRRLTMFQCQNFLRFLIDLTRQSFPLGHFPTWRRSSRILWFLKSGDIFCGGFWEPSEGITPSSLWLCLSKLLRHSPLRMLFRTCSATSEQRVKERKLDLGVCYWFLWYREILMLTFDSLGRSPLRGTWD